MGPAGGVLRQVSALFIFRSAFLGVREPVWPSGKAVGWEAEGPQFEFASAVLSLQHLWSVDTVL